MREMAMVFSHEGKALFWLGPRGHTEGSIPDSEILWQRIWSNRAEIGGVAHTHPWDGKPGPSHTDVTTWDAIERALGKRMLWPIVSMTDVVFYVRNPLTGEFVETPSTFAGQKDWLEIVEELRRTSRGLLERT